MNTVTNGPLAPITAAQLRELVLDEDSRRVYALLEPRTAAELKPLLKELPALRREVRELELKNWNFAHRRRLVLAVAAAFCVQTPAQAAAWVGRAEAFREYKEAVSDPVELLRSRHGDAWIGELAQRLGKRMGQTVDADYWAFVDRLAVEGGVELPLSAGRLRGWLVHAIWGRHRGRQRSQQPSLLDWLRTQPRLPDYITGVFEVDDIGGNFVVWQGVRPDPQNEWPFAIAALAEEGLLDRAAVLEACTARLLRGDRPGSLRGHLEVLEALKPTPAEVGERYGTYASMAASGASTVAKAALRELRALDTAEPFEPMDLAGLSESVLARPESGLAVAQLGWLDAALKRDKGAAAILLPCLGSAFAHPTTATQQRAIKLLAKYVSVADSRTLEGLREAALSLDAALRADADRLFAASDPASSPAFAGDAPSLALPEYLPAALPPLPGTPEELLTALAPAFTPGGIGPLEVEQIMAAFAILAHQDRAALAAAFRPFADRQAEDARHAVFRYALNVLPGALCNLFYAVLGEDLRKHRVRLPDQGTTPPNTLTLLRIQELTDHLLSRGTVPILLATPTEASGAVDRAVLAERAEAYLALGTKPLPYDFEQARARAEGRPELREALDALAEAEIGLRERELPTPQRRTVTVFGRFGVLPKLSLAGPKIDARSVLYPELAKDGSPRFPQHYRSWSADHQSPHWPTLLPHDPDMVAAHAMIGLRMLASDESADSETIFPGLADTAGQPGLATHLALAYGLAADRLEHRIAAQDALLTFAARKLLVPEQLGCCVAELWIFGGFKANRVLDGLARCEQAGAAAEVLGVTGAMIGRLARRPHQRGVADLLLLATRCAIASGTRGVEIPGLAGLAALPKPKRVAAEARRLSEALGLAR